MNKGWFAAITAAIVLLGAGLIRLSASPPHGPSITLVPPPTSELLVVHVTGAVAQPGVYQLPSGSRVQDAVEMAGGFTSGADLSSINLAELLDDGKQIVIAIQGESVKATPEKKNPEKPSRTAQLVNINDATQAELETLPGIGPVIAQKIIDYRNESGPFESIEGLIDVPGIGQVTFEHIKNLVTVGDSSPNSSAGFP